VGASAPAAAVARVLCSRVSDEAGTGTAVGSGTGARDDMIFQQRPAGKEDLQEEVMSRAGKENELKKCESPNERKSWLLHKSWHSITSDPFFATRQGLAGSGMVEAECGSRQICQHHEWLRVRSVLLTLIASSDCRCQLKLTSLLLSVFALDFSLTSGNLRLYGTKATISFSRSASIAMNQEQRQASSGEGGWNRSLCAKNIGVFLVQDSTYGIIRGICGRFFLWRLSTPFHIFIKCVNFNLYVTCS
jgi:hypothetical protein